MAAEVVVLIPGYFSWVSSPETASSSEQQRGTCYCLTKIKDMFFSQQPELKICWDRIRDHFIHS
jgi:hypothetical protein